MVALVFIFTGFMLDSLPISVWFGRLVAGSDIRSAGPDRNPGAANAWRGRATWKGRRLPCSQLHWW